MHHKGKWLLALVGTVLSGSAVSQDLFRSTNTMVHSYNYLEVQYLVDTEASPPLLATLLIDVSDRLSVKAEYRNQDFDFPAADESQLDLSFDAQTLAVGGLYHRPLAGMTQSDWIAGFMIGREQVTVQIPALAIDEDVDTDFQEFYAGLRRTFSSRIEGEVALNYYRTDDNSQLSGDAKLVLRALDSVDIALAINNLGDTDLFGIGLRYTW